MTMSEADGARECRTDELHPVRNARYDGEPHAREGESERGSH